MHIETPEASEGRLAAILDEPVETRQARLRSMRIQNRRSLLKESKEAGQPQCSPTVNFTLDAPVLAPHKVYTFVHQK
ncbi:Hypothetical predicted protein [Octopus vulgaris]|uniref:Uncharacterized protein n=1 Tax=Octopus vulgaris TaxID=6645 RepID=A0AA36B0I8_OCTVU|nr:Hypothetical predicted protein [Octopus vulgaris]